MDLFKNYSSDMDVKNGGGYLVKDVVDYPPSNFLDDTKSFEKENDKFNIVEEDEFFCQNLSTIDEIIDRDKENCVNNINDRRNSLFLSTILEELPTNSQNNSNKKIESEYCRDERDEEMSFLNNEVEAYKTVMETEKSLSEILVQLCEENSDIFSDDDIVCVKKGDLAPLKTLINNFRDMKNLLGVVNERLDIQKRIDEL